MTVKASHVIQLSFHTVPQKATVAITQMLIFYVFTLLMSPSSSFKTKSHYKCRHSSLSLSLSLSLCLDQHNVSAND